MSNDKTLNTHVTALKSRYGVLKNFPYPEFSNEGMNSVSLASLTLVEQGSPYMNDYIRSVIRHETDNVVAATLDATKRTLDHHCKFLRHADDTVEKIKRIVPLFDGELGVLKTTCALGLMQPTHSFLEEFGSYSLYQKAQDDYTLLSHDYFVAHYKRMGIKARDYKSVEASYPRGKNSGVPIIVSGGDRLLSDFIMFHNMILGSLLADELVNPNCNAEEFRVFLASCVSLLEREYGKLMFIVFDRYQHNGKHIPMRVDNQKLMSKNFEFRRRAINATVKMLAMALKPAISAITEFDLATPSMTQDREAISSRIKRCINSGGVVMAYDQSRFDFRHGFDKLDMSGRLLAKQSAMLLNVAEDKIFQLIDLESTLPALLLHDKQAFIANGKANLKSGESGTSRKGCRMNFEDDFKISFDAYNMSRESLTAHYLRYEPTILLSDDILKLFPSSEIAEKYERASGVTSKKMGFSYEPELPIKFLGSYVITKDPTNPWKVSLMSSLIKIYWPERFKRAAAIPLSLRAKLDGFTKSYPSASVSNVFKCMRDSYNFISENHPRVNDLMKTAIKSIPDSYTSFIGMTDDMMAHPDKYGLNNDFESIDEILNIFGRGLEYDADFSRIGLGHLNELKDDAVIKTTTKISDVQKQLNDAIGGSSNVKVKQNARTHIYARILDDYNKALDDPKAKNIDKFFLVNDVVLRHLTELGLRHNKGSYAFSFRFSKERLMKAKKRTYEQSLDEFIEANETE